MMIRDPERLKPPYRDDQLLWWQDLLLAATVLALYPVALYLHPNATWLWMGVLFFFILRDVGGISSEVRKGRRNFYKEFEKEHPKTAFLSKALLVLVFLAVVLFSVVAAVNPLTDIEHRTYIFGIGLLLILSFAGIAVLHCGWMLFLVLARSGISSLTDAFAARAGYMPLHRHMLIFFIGSLIHCSLLLLVNVNPSMDSNELIQIESYGVFGTADASFFLFMSLYSLIFVGQLLPFYLSFLMSRARIGPVARDEDASE